MRILISLLVLASAAGCASRVLSPEDAQKMSILDLCAGIVTFRPHNSKVAQEEAVRRGVDCKQHEGAVNAQIGAPTPASTYVPPRTCRSYRVGNTVQTQCF